MNINETNEPSVMSVMMVDYSSESWVGAHGQLRRIPRRCCHDSQQYSLARTFIARIRREDLQLPRDPFSRSLTAASSESLVKHRVSM